MVTSAFHHDPVLLAESMACLDPHPGEIFVDCTVGGGGHARALAARLGPGGLLVGIDRDAEALAAARQVLRDLPGGPRVVLLHGNFRQLRALLAAEGIAGVDGVLFDLGVSSHQLDVAGRGFSYRQDAPLDMRMDPRGGPSAADLVNNLPVQELAGIIFRYGEERYARRIAAAIAARRPLTTTGELAAVIRAAVPPAARREGHPARRTFQALRIAVNDELGALAEGLRAAVEALRPGGRVAAISFHSLEDRLVKQFFQEMARGCHCPPAQPVCTCDGRPVLEILTRKPLEAGKEEKERNPRSRSARLRAARKLPDQDGTCMAF